MAIANGGARGSQASTVAHRNGTAELPKKPGTRAPRHPSNRGARAGFIAGLIVTALVLLLLIYLVGHGPDIGLGGFSTSLFQAISQPGAALVEAFALLAIIAWCFSRIWLERLATRPGRVEVPVFTKTSALNAVDANHLTAMFRQRLATLRLQAPTPVPGSAAPGEFLEVLGERGLDSRNLLGSLLAIARAAKPHHAWEVHGVLVEREISPKYGVTVQVVRLPGEGSPPDTVYDYSWERAIRRAADRATAHILPRTDLCRSPWATWHGFVMPPELVEAYEDAASLETQRRYDEAVARYYDVLRADPMNLVVRLQLGQLEEKLGLYLDALAIYEGMVIVTEPGGQRIPNQFYEKEAAKERCTAELMGRYRRVVLLGGPAFAWQWYREPDRIPTERDTQRRQLRNRLAIGLGPKLEEIWAAQHLADQPYRDRREVAELLAAPDVWPDGVSSAGDKGWMQLQLRQLMAVHALAELATVDERLEELRESADDPNRLPLSPAGVELTRICVRERVRWVTNQLSCEPRRWIWDDARGARLQREVKEAGRTDRLRRWHEHYNAACAMALPLLVKPDGDLRPDSDESRVRNVLACEAIRHLEQATACADSGYIATRRDWLLSEDPDLLGLRSHPRFKAFEALYLPDGRVTPRRPRDVQPLETATYTRDLLVATARRCQAIWHDRRPTRTRATSASSLDEWWRNERDAWKAVGRVSVHYRHSRARLDLLRLMDAFSRSCEYEPLDVAFGRYDDSWLPKALSHDTVDELGSKALEASRVRLRTFAGVLQPGGEGPARIAQPIDEWIGYLLDADSDGALPDRATIVQACELHSALWGRMREWLTADEDAASAAHLQFSRQLNAVIAFLTAAEPGGARFGRRRNALSA